MNRYLLQAARKFGDRVAIIEGEKQFTYSQLVKKSANAQAALKDLGLQKGDRICLFGEKTADYAAVQLAAWRLGATAITLLPSYPATELEYFVEDSGSKILIASDLVKAKDVANRVQSRVQVRTYQPKSLVESNTTNGDGLSTSLDVTNNDDDAACFIYTSGSTSKPKGVVTTHGALKAMVDGMVEAWKWTENDYILHLLPLHHIHGAVNKLLTPLCAGAKVEFVEFEAQHIISRLNVADDELRPTIFMGVPTIYAKLVEKWERDGDPELEHLKKLRLFVCGSAPLPVHLFETFSRLSKQPILERWGMTEVGMGLSNPLFPPEKRHAGFVGLPMPGIEVKLVDLDADPSGRNVVPADHPGDLLIRGKSVFKTYWGNAAKKTVEEFTPDGWFKTGDVALYDTKNDSYKIVGRKSVDIIKSSGYKISALEIERALLNNNDYDEVAVLGIPDDVWGESVVAIIAPKQSAFDKVDEASVQAFAAKHLVKYKIPRRVLVMKSIPKNAMGKFNKKSLRDLFQSDSSKAKKQ